MPGQYAPLPNSAVDADAERELERTFATSDDEDEDDHVGHSAESAPLMKHHHTTSSSATCSSGPTVTGAAAAGSYDFEAFDWIAPPPGSPPAPSTLARPNDHGNTNGVVGTEPVARPPPPRPSFFRRAVGALLPQHYAPLPTSEEGSSSRRVVGAGISGVFANVVAKPTRPVEVRDADGNVHMVPETTQREAPPSYATAQLDTVPPYWDTTGATSSDPYAEVMLEDLPVGTFIVFACNIFISFFFQFVGFLMTYLMHTTHAAKYGSRVGLGLTMIQYGYYTRIAQIEGMPTPNDDSGFFGTVTFNSTSVTTTSVNGTTTSEDIDEATTAAYAHWLQSREWLAFIFMALGWFIVLTSCIGFLRVKRYERSLRSSLPAPTTSSQETTGTSTMSRALARAFGINLTARQSASPSNPPPRARRDPTPEEQAAELRLRRDLEAAGFI